MKIYLTSHVFKETQIKVRFLLPIKMPTNVAKGVGSKTGTLTLSGEQFVNMC